MAFCPDDQSVGLLRTGMVNGLLTEEALTSFNAHFARHDVHR
jgi:hypothetical protein